LIKVDPLSIPPSLCEVGLATAIIGAPVFIVIPAPAEPVLEPTIAENIFFLNSEKY